jgi:hypothetical protein
VYPVIYVIHVTEFVHTAFGIQSHFARRLYAVLKMRNCVVNINYLCALVTLSYSTVLLCVARYLFDVNCVGVICLCSNAMTFAVYWCLV